MKRGRIRRSEPGKIGGGRGTKGRSSKRVGDRISQGKLHNNAQYFAIE